MDLVRGRVVEVLAGTMGGAFVEGRGRILVNAGTGGRRRGCRRWEMGEPPEGGTTERGVRDGWESSLLGG